MGRPSLVVSPFGRTTRQRDTGEHDEGNYPRRLPRTGNSYQARDIPDIEDIYESRRALPHRVSDDFPFATVEEEARAGTWLVR